MSTNLTDYDLPGDTKGAVSTDESAAGRSKTTLLITSRETKTPERTEGDSTEDYTKTSTKDGDTEEAKSTADESEPLFEAEEESQLPVSSSGPCPTIGVGGDNKDTQFLSAGTISSRKRQSPASRQHSDNTPAVIGHNSSADFGEETHDGPRKSATGSGVANPSVEGEETEEPPAKYFKPSRDA